MSAKSVVGVRPEIAEMMDVFWNGLSLEHRAALHTAFSLCSRINPMQPSMAAALLRNASSGSSSVSSVRGDFFWFLAARVEVCHSAEEMMCSVLTWGGLSVGEQEETLHDPK